MRSVVLASLVAVLAGCVATAPVQPVQTAEQWAQSVTTSRDDFTKMTTVQGTMFHHNSNTQFLRAIRAPESPAQETVQLYVIARVDSWKFLDRAYTLDGTAWPTYVVDRDVRSCNRYGCALAEHVTVTLPLAYLAGKSDTGIDVKLIGRRGEEYVYLPGPYISGFLANLPALPRQKP